MREWKLINARHTFARKTSYAYIVGKARPLKLRRDENARTFNIPSTVRVRRSGSRLSMTIPVRKKKKEKCRTLKTRLPPNPTSPSSIFACNRIQAAPYLLRFSRRVNVKEAQRRIAEILISPTFRAKKELAYSSLARPLSSLSISLSSSSTERPPREKENESRVASLAGSFFLVDSD